MTDHVKLSYREKIDVRALCDVPMRVSVCGCVCLCPARMVTPSWAMQKVNDYLAKLPVHFDVPKVCVVTSLGHFDMSTSSRNRVSWNRLRLLEMASVLLSIAGNKHTACLVTVVAVINGLLPSFLALVGRFDATHACSELGSRDLPTCSLPALPKSPVSVPPFLATV